MTIPKWAVAAASVIGTLVGAIIGIVTTSLAAGERLGQMSQKIEHLTAAIAPAVVTVGVHEARLVGAETRLNYCCPAVAPKASSSAGDVPSRAADATSGTPRPRGTGSAPSPEISMRSCRLNCELTSTALGWTEPGVMFAMAQAGVRAGAQRDGSAASRGDLGTGHAGDDAVAHHGARIASTPSFGSSPTSVPARTTTF